MGKLILRDVKKSFGMAEVIKGIDLTVEDGEFCVFVGPSGCGKSTLLRMIAGLEEVTSGEVSLDGREITGLAPAKREIAMVFQSYALYPHLSVRDNMGLALKQAGTPKAEIREATDRAAAMLGLEALMERRPADLSGGQRQRVAIGRAIVRRPKLFLFDEPLSNLDAALRVQTRIEIARLHRELGATTIYVTHDQVEAMTLAHKIVVLRGGRIEQTGAPMDLYHDPDNIFVAGFIGSPQMNFLQSGPLGLRSDRIGIRPEQISLTREADASAQLQGRVSHIERLGSETLVYVDCADQGLITLRLFGAETPEVETRVGLKLNTGQMFHFDETGQRIR
ncbi:ABC transporter ATP-binding protein [Pseudogemmobacter faecipullorum]|uniref:ATP-binding cassette domain-containing protein n=1 Tax=Pseudogemmobacter faecipullorum TaxID=2755041 RepID=A0ABS8CJJ5_9RHOB|nr:ATP-binding cassette domain-containing protein [Pseudogemmobacter faecipullorum]MCB5409544.1 ATP-binding cassette domain-containing protein [Pseudogemmobacter faecipullorum]